MLLALFAFATLCAAHAITRRLLPNLAAGWEYSSAVGIGGLACASAVNWVLGLTHTLTAGGLCVASLGLVALSARDVLRSVRSIPSEFGISRSEAAFALLLVAPAIAWLAYVLWRGSVLFAGDHDGLSYHLPKAIELYRAHGYARIDAHTTGIETYPADYELLLADVMCLTASDRLTEWVCTATYVVCGLCVGGLSERWWGRGWHTLPVVLLALGMPVALLHSGTHKNDLMFSACVLAAASFAARWTTERDRGSFFVAALAVALAIGTKVNGVFLALVVLPLALRPAAAWWKQREPSAAAIAACGAVALGACTLIGGVTYLENLVRTHSLAARPESAGYGDWQNLWMFPLLTFLRPFTGDQGWIPWTGARWFWPAYDLYFSHFGVPSSLLLLATAFGVARYASTGPVPAVERALGSYVLGATFFATLPIRLDLPIGFFEGYVRYVMFLPPLVMLWTVGPWMRELAARSRQDRVGGGSRRLGGPAGAAFTATALAASGAFAFYAFNCARFDRYAPFSFLAHVIRHPEAARVVPDRFHAANWLDSHAGSRDVVAFDGSSIDAWAYPLYGDTLERQVIYLHPDRGQVTIPDDVQWVVIDRAWNRLFGDPSFHDFGDWRTALLHGRLTDLDLRLYRQMKADPRYRLVYRDKVFNQAVFERTTPSSAMPAEHAPAD